MGLTEFANVRVRRGSLADFQTSNQVFAPGEPLHVIDATHNDWLSGDGKRDFNTLWSDANSIANRAKASADAAAASAVAAAASGGRTEAVRFTAANLPSWSRKKQLALLNQAPARVLCVGDSTTAGVYSDSYSGATGSTNQGGPNAYPARLAAYLSARGIPAAVAMAIPGHNGNDDARWGGYIQYAGGNLGWAGNGALSFTSAQNVTTLTPGVKADTFIVYFYGDGGTGTINAQATGGAAVTITTSAGANGIKKATVIAPAASTSNVLTLSWLSGTSFVTAVEFYDSSNPNLVRVLPAGVGGSQADQWANGASSDTFGGRAMIRAIAADLTILSLGINDAAAGRTASQVLADVTALATVASATGDALLMSAFPHPGPSAVDTINDAYLASSYAYVDLAWRYGHNMMAWGLMTNDQTHPNALGYGDAASVVARLL